ncbi:MAG: hypothetical protein KTR31_27605 [Myxococcales bacterium]|nr:hypothetical protein [Myxococcales bacterium]
MRWLAITTTLGCTGAEPELPLPPYDDCDEASAAKALPPGSYSFDSAGLSSLLNPGLEGCARSDLAGPDALFPVELSGNGTLLVNLDMPGGNPAVYLLRDCASDCVLGFHAPAESLVLSYSNQRPEPERLYIVVDTADELLPFMMSLSLF